MVSGDPDGDVSMRLMILSGALPDGFQEDRRANALAALVNPPQVARFGDGLCL
jgi:hypothetical protein